MPEFLARRKRTKTKRPVSFETDSGIVSFKARRRPKKRYRIDF